MLGLELVRALPGVVEGKSAVNGVLVTTSWAGKASRDLAACHGWIKIIDGQQLKSLLRDHHGLDARISPPRPGLPQN